VGDQKGGKRFAENIYKKRQLGHDVYLAWEATPKTIDKGEKDSDRGQGHL